MGRACGMKGKKRNTHWVLVGSLKDRDQLVDLGVNGRLLTRAVKKYDRVGVGWINLARDGTKWRAVVNTIMNN
jgi:hypothetical protein